MVFIEGALRDELSHVQLYADMGYDMPMHDLHLPGSPSTPTSTQEELGFTQVGVSLVSHPKSTIVFAHYDCLPVFFQLWEMLQ